MVRTQAILCINQALVGRRIPFAASRPFLRHNPLCDQIEYPRPPNLDREDCPEILSWPGRR